MILRNALVDESIDPREKKPLTLSRKLITSQVMISSSTVAHAKANKPFERLRIRRLKSRELTEPFEAIVERDGSGYIARTLDLPVYGYGEDIVEAVDILKEDIEMLYEELMEDDNLTEEWKRVKLFLSSIVLD